MTITLDIKNLSEEIHLAVKTIRSTLVNNPKALPPRLVIPGQKKLLWLRSDVEDFYQRQAKGHGSNPDYSSKPPVLMQSIVSTKKKRGRPTKAEQIQKVKMQAEKKIGGAS
jgi:hypothetical protein